MPEPPMERSLDGLPPVLTVEETARFLRIGRATAYEGVRMYLGSGGAAGIPAIRVGPRTIRVPRAALLDLLGQVGPADQHAQHELHAHGQSERSAERGGTVEGAS